MLYENDVDADEAESETDGAENKRINVRDVCKCCVLFDCMSNRRNNIQYETNGKKVDSIRAQSASCPVRFDPFAARARPPLAGAIERTNHLITRTICDHQSICARDRYHCSTSFNEVIKQLQTVYIFSSPLRALPPLRRVAKCNGKRITFCTPYMRQRM